MSKMVQKNRLDRVHVVNVRGKDDKFYVIFSDGSEMSWAHWIDGGREEIIWA